MNKNEENEYTQKKLNIHRRKLNVGAKIICTLITTC